MRRGGHAALLGLRGGAVLATIMGEPLVVGGDIILKVQGVPVGEASDHRRVRDILQSIPPGRRIHDDRPATGPSGRAQGPAPLTVSDVVATTARRSPTPEYLDRDRLTRVPTSSRSSYSMQGNPHTIEEVRRILRLHVGLKTDTVPLEAR